jgi:hypothetical protein
VLLADEELVTEELVMPVELLPEGEELLPEVPVTEELADAELVDEELETDVLETDVLETDVLETDSAELLELRLEDVDAEADAVPEKLVRGCPYRNPRCRIIPELVGIAEPLRM